VNSRRFRTFVVSAAACLLVRGEPARSQTCATVAQFDDGLTPTRVLHVATTGSNVSGNGSPGKPYATIAFAAGQATPGTSVVVHAGIYAGGGFITGLSGTSAAPIWIGGAPGESRPIIQGGGEGLHIVKPRYLIIHDLEVRSVASNGINCDDGGDYANADAARFMIFRNLSIHDIGGTGNQDGLKLSGLNDFVVIGCDFARCGGANSGSGIDHVGCHRGLIVRCTFNDLSANAVQCKGGSEDLEVRWCRMIEAGQRAVNMGGSTGLEFFRPPVSITQPNFEAQNIRVVSNLIIGAEAPIAYVGCVDCLVSGNTIITPHNWIIRVLQETVTQAPYSFIPCSGGRFVNNIVYFDRSDLSTYVNIGANTAPQTFSFENNLWYAYDNPAASAPSLPVLQSGAVIGLDPRFFEATAGNYALQFLSPAASVGHSPPESAGDLAGICYRHPPSIGAFEVCYPNCDGSAGGPGLTANDFQCFLDKFVAGEPYANCDSSTGTPLLTGNDFQCFLNAYVAGCS